MGLKILALLLLADAAFALALPERLRARLRVWLPGNRLELVAAGEVCLALVLWLLS